MSCCRCNFRIWPDQTVRQDVRVVDANGQGITGAAVEATLIDQDTGDPIPGIPWPVTLTEVGGGTYRFEEDTTPLGLEIGQEVVFQVVATLGAFIARQSCWTPVTERSLECV